MRTITHQRHYFLAIIVLISLVFAFPKVMANNADQPTRLSKVQERAAFWSVERRQNAIPRDFVIDSRGLGYLKTPLGDFTPYGHDTQALPPKAVKASPRRRPGGNGDSEPPVVTDMNPEANTTIGGSYTFSAAVRDAGSGVKSVSFVIRFPNGTNTQSFTPSYSSADTWSITINGFSDNVNDWAWRVVAKDNAGKRGNTVYTDYVPFHVSTSTGEVPPPSGTSDSISNEAALDYPDMYPITGRIYFEMPSNKKWNRPWVGYVCSGSVVTDDDVSFDANDVETSRDTHGRSIVLTAAHCIYDDANKAFARNVLFIPDQSATTGSGTDIDCSNDRFGCWSPSFAVVDPNWAGNLFPENIEWDYGYYVVSDTGSHTTLDLTQLASFEDGFTADLQLDATVGSLNVHFASAPVYDDSVVGTDSPGFTYAFGYSFADDPKLMLCADDLTTEGSVNWWLPICGLSGGASGGPWLQAVEVGSTNSHVVSVNSWGYTSGPGMAGPSLTSNSAECLFNLAVSTAVAEVMQTDGDEGIVADECL